MAGFKCCFASFRAFGCCLLMVAGFAYAGDRIDLSVPAAQTAQQNSNIPQGPLAAALRRLAVEMDIQEHQPDKGAY